MGAAYSAGSRTTPASWIVTKVLGLMVLAAISSSVLAVCCMLLGATWATTLASFRRIGLITRDEKGSESVERAPCGSR